METIIVKILSDTTVVLGAGKENGVKEGMEFELFELGEEILDPLTKTSLGQLELVKGRVYVTSVQARVSIAQTRSETITRTKTITQEDTWLRLAGIRREEYEVEKTTRLNVEGVDKNYAKKLVVRVGDKARAVQ